MTTTARTPSSAAASATPCAWFPAEEQTTPRARSSSDSRASLTSGPRSLYEPVRWNSSALSRTSKPVSSDSDRDVSSGVRRAALIERAREQQLGGVVLFDSTYVLYYVGFAFIPTERPIALVLSPEGEAALVVPRLEVEHARSQPGVDRVEHYDEYPGDPRAEVALTRTLEALGIGDRVGADHDGYPWILGYRGPALSELVEAKVVRVGA